MTRVHEQALLEKLRYLAPEQVAEAEHFVDVLTQRQADERRLSHAVSQLAAAALARVWDNPDDADYDRL